MADRVIRAVLTGSSAGAVKAFEETALAAEGSGKRASAAVAEHGNKASSALSSIGGTLSKVGGLAAASLLGMGGFAVKMAGDFQESMTQLVTGAGESEANIGLISKGLLDMAGQTGTSAQDLAKSMFTVESAGFHAQQGLDVMRVAAEAAKVGGADLQTTADGLTTALNAYGLTSKDATSVSNQMVATVAAGKTTMQDLAGSLSAVLPVAASAHVSLAQIGGAMATMTGQGMSAQQASQDLANTIGQLQNPSQVAVKEMAAMGLNSTQVSQQLGTKGLTGTLGELTAAITAHMGPAGTVLQNSFNQSKAAAADAQTMMEHLPKSLQGIAKEFLNNQISAKDWRADLKNLTPEQKALASQFATTAENAHGFNDLLKSGSPAAQTYNAALSDMLGGQTGLDTALMLTGGHMATFQANTDAVATAGKNASKDVNGWADVQKDFNFKLDQAKATAEALAIKIGSALIPILERAMTVTQGVIAWFEKHRTTATALAGVIGTVLVGAIVVYIGNMAIAAAKSAIEFAQMIAKGVAWVAAHVAQVATVGSIFVVLWVRRLAEDAAQGAIWLATNAARLATWVAANTAALATVVAEWIAETAVMIGTAIAAAAEMLVALAPILIPLAAIGVAIYELATHWSQVWGAIKAAVSDAAGFIGTALGAIKSTLGGWIGDIASFFRSIPGTLKSIGGDILGAITFPWRAAMHFIAAAWNNTLGKLSFSAPSWVPVIGGKGFSMPQLYDPGMPSLDVGGEVLSTGVAVVHRGEVFSGANGETSLPGGANVYNDNRSFTVNAMAADPQAVVNALKQYMRSNGSVPVTVNAARRLGAA